MKSGRKPRRKAPCAQAPEHLAQGHRCSSWGKPTVWRPLEGVSWGLQAGVWATPGRAGGPSGCPVSPKVWQCGGSMEVLPCSRVAHIERSKKPYNNDIDYYAKRNALRAAEVWMDSFKSHVYMAWNIPMTVSCVEARGWASRAGVQAHPPQGAHLGEAPRMPVPLRGPTLCGG